jgi:hypothetical protein
MKQLSCVEHVGLFMAEYGWRSIESSDIASTFRPAITSKGLVAQCFKERAFDAWRAPEKRKYRFGCSKEERL